MGITSIIGPSPSPGPAPPTPPSPPSPPSPTPPAPPSPQTGCCGNVKSECGPSVVHGRVTYAQCVSCGKKSDIVDKVCSSKSKMKDCCDDLFPWPPSFSNVTLV